MCATRVGGYSNCEVSTATTRQLRDRGPAVPEAIARLRHAVVDFAARGGATARQREDIALAVSEALTNVVQHAYAQAPVPGVMAVQAAINDGSLVLVVCDDGAGMPPPADRPASGLGLALIAIIADRLELNDTTRGTRVRMTFAIG